MKVFLSLFIILVLLSACDFDAYQGYDGPDAVVVLDVDPGHYTEGSHQVEIRVVKDASILVSNATISGVTELHIIAPYVGVHTLVTPAAGETFYIEINGERKTYEVM